MQLNQGSLSEVIVVDDIIPQQKQIEIEKAFLDNSSMYWMYNQSSNYGTSDQYEVIKTNPLYNLHDKKKYLKYPNIIDTFFFVHPMWDERGVVSNYYPMLMDILKQLNLSKLIRIKANITTYDSRFDDSTHGYPHTDMGGFGIKDYVTGIYYINDSSGDTFIFNEKFTDKTDALTIKKRILPKRGRLVLFDGTLLHAGNNPRDNSPRAVLNINYTMRNR